MAREIVHTTDLWHEYTKQASASTSSTVINLTVSHWIDMVNWSSQHWQKCSGALECCAKLLVDGPWLQWLPKKSTSDNDFLNITAFKIFVFLFDQSSSLIAWRRHRNKKNQWALSYDSEHFYKPHLCIVHYSKEND